MFFPLRGRKNKNTIFRAITMNRESVYGTCGLKAWNANINEDIYDYT